LGDLPSSFKLSPVTRLFFSSSLLTAFTALLVLSACDANTTEGCIGGVCDPGSGGSGATTTTGASGGGGSGGGAEPPATGDFPCEVFAIIHDKCNPCHTDPPKNGAPFPILTYEDTQLPFGTKGKKRYERMAEVIAPASGPFMPLQPNGEGVTPLSEAELGLLSAWLAAPTAEAQGKGCECPGTGCD
jgi:hypothetical protein